ncbi:MAG: hypothetical protein WC373_03265, partial [Smithella sp.]
MQDSCFDTLMRISYITKPICYRLLLGKILPQYEKCIYLDAILSFVLILQSFSLQNCLINLNKIREDGMTETFLREIKKGYMFADQDVLNITCQNKIRHLPV